MSNLEKKGPIGKRIADAARKAEEQMKDELQKGLDSKLGRGVKKVYNFLEAARKDPKIQDVIRDRTTTAGVNQVAYFNASNEMRDNIRTTIHQHAQANADAINDLYMKEYNRQALQHINGYKEITDQMKLKNTERSTSRLRQFGSAAKRLFNMRVGASLGLSAIEGFALGS